LKEHLRRLGTEMDETVRLNFDDIYDRYKEKALSEGYFGPLRFIREHGKVLIYAVISQND
jgi:hypothetical protein